MPQLVAEPLGRGIATVAASSKASHYRRSPPEPPLPSLPAAPLGINCHARIASITVCGRGGCSGICSIATVAAGSAWHPIPPLPPLPPLPLPLLFAVAVAVAEGAFTFVTAVAEASTIAAVSAALADALSRCAADAAIASDPTCGCCRIAGIVIAAGIGAYVPPLPPGAPLPNVPFAPLAPLAPFRYLWLPKQLGKNGTAHRLPVRRQEIDCSSKANVAASKGN